MRPRELLMISTPWDERRTAALVSPDRVSLRPRVQDPRRRRGDRSDRQVCIPVAPALRDSGQVDHVHYIDQLSTEHGNTRGGDPGIDDSDPEKAGDRSSADTATRGRRWCQGSLDKEVVGQIGQRSLSLPDLIPPFVNCDLPAGGAGAPSRRPRQSSFCKIRTVTMSAARTWAVAP